MTILFEALKARCHSARTAGVYKWNGSKWVWQKQ
jgi:hypothetical protein